MSALAKKMESFAMETSPKPKTYRILRDFGMMVGSSFQKFQANQSLNDHTDKHLIDTLLAANAPIEADGERTLETCPRCKHVFASTLEKK